MSGVKDKNLKYLIEENIGKCVKSEITSPLNDNREARGASFKVERISEHFHRRRRCDSVD